MSDLPTRQECIRRAARTLEFIREERDARTPREAAEAAWYPSHRLGSVEAIEALIIRQRENALAKQAAAAQSASQAA